MTNNNFISSGNYPDNIPINDSYDSPDLAQIYWNPAYEQYVVPVYSNGMIINLYFNTFNHTVHSPEMLSHYFVYDVYGTNELYFPQDFFQEDVSLEMLDHHSHRLRLLFAHNFSTHEPKSNIIHLSQNLQPQNPLSDDLSAPGFAFKYRVVSFGERTALAFPIDVFFNKTQSPKPEKPKVVNVFPCKYLAIKDNENSLIPSDYPYANFPDSYPVCTNFNFASNNVNHPNMCSFYLFVKSKIDLNAFQSCSGYEPTQESIIDNNIYLSENSQPIRISLSKKTSLNNSQILSIHNHTENVNIMEASCVDGEFSDKDIQSFYDEVISCYTDSVVETYVPESEDLSKKSYFQTILKV